MNPRNNAEGAFSAAAVTIVSLHVLALWQFSVEQQILWSNALQLLSALTAAGAYACAGARSRGFVRRFCWLSASTFGLWSVAQSGWFYHEYHLHAVVPTVSPINVLFFFFVAPLGIAVLLPLEKGTTEGSAPFFLDALQMGAVLVTAYLYFFYAPAFWAGRPTQLDQAIRRASEWRNWILTAALVVRALLATRPTVRRLFSGMAVVFGLYAVGESMFFDFTSPGTLNTGKWFDLTWSVPFAVAVVFLRGIPASEEEEQKPRGEGIRFNIAIHLMPAMIPLLVLITAARIVKDQLVIAAAAVLMSFACYSLRLFITQREAQRATAALRDSEAMFSLAFKQNPNLVMLGKVEAGPIVRLKDVNDATVTFWGGPREELIGKTGLELDELARSTSGVPIVFLDREEFWRVFQDQGRVSNKELRLRRRSGEIHTFMATADPFLFNGEKWLLVTARDVSEEKAAEEALRASEEKYRDLFENAHDVIFTASPAGRVLSLNKMGQTVCGLSLLEALHSRVQDSLDEASSEVYENFVSQMLLTLRPTTCEVTLQRASGGTTMLELALRPIVEHGIVTAIQGIGRDVTEHRLLEKKLLQSQKMEAIGTLAGGVAHDFNNLLTVITGYGQLAKEQLGKDNEAFKDLEEIQGAAQRAAALTSQLLAFSRNHVPQRVALNLNECVCGMEKMLRRLIGEDIIIQSELESAIPAIWADPTQIDQIIMNVAANARDAMPSGGMLRFVTSLKEMESGDARLNLAAGIYVVLTAQDSGIGMNEATAARIFDPFFTTKEVGKGTGLGLSTVYGIVQQMGGQISVTSEPGRGTKFTFYFPAGDPARNVPSSQPAEEAVSGSETILLVEDDPALRNLVERVLDDAGYTVYGASSVGEAERISLEISGEIAAVVSDVVMPDGGGVEFVSKLLKTRPKIKVLFTSGYTDGKVPKELLEGEQLSFLAKPFKPDQLARKIRTLLDTSQDLSACLHH